MANRFAHCTRVSEVNAAVVGVVESLVLDLPDLTDTERVTRIRKVLAEAEERLRELGGKEPRSLPGHCARCERMLVNAEAQRGLCDACTKPDSDVRSQQTCQRCGELMLAEGYCVDCPEKHVGFVCETPGCSNRGFHLHSGVTQAAWLQAAEGVGRG